MESVFRLQSATPPTAQSSSAHVWRVVSSSGIAGWEKDAGVGALPNEECVHQRRAIVCVHLLAHNVTCWNFFRGIGSVVRYQQSNCFYRKIADAKIDLTRKHCQPFNSNLHNMWTKWSKSSVTRWKSAGKPKLKRDFLHAPLRICKFGLCTDRNLQLLLMEIDSSQVTSNQAACNAKKFKLLFCRSLLWLDPWLVVFHLYCILFLKYSVADELMSLLWRWCGGANCLCTADTGRQWIYPDAGAFPLRLDYPKVDILESVSLWQLNPSLSNGKQVYGLSPGSSVFERRSGGERTTEQWNCLAL